MSEALANLLNETRQFPPPAELAANANVTADAYDEAAADRLAFWARQADRLTWAKPWDAGAGLVEPAVREVVRRRRSSTWRTTAWTGTSRPATATRSRSTGRASRATPAPSPTPTCTELTCQAANTLTDLGVDGRRPGGDLPADDPGGGGGDAGLRPDRRDPQRGLRRLLRRRADQPDPGRQRQGGDHRRRRVPAGQAVGAEADRGRGGGELPVASSTCWWSAAPARTSPGRRRTTGGTRRWRQRRPEHERAAVRRRAPAVHPLHQRHHRPSPKGILHTTGGYLTQASYTDARGLRPQAGDRRLLVHRRHRLGDRALLHRLRPARQRRHPGDVRGHAGHPAQGPVLGDRREVPGDHPLHRADADPHDDEVGRRHPGRLRPVVAAAAGQRRRADQPRGVDVVPAARRPRRAARSWTPGGRPRPAPS